MFEGHSLRVLVGDLKSVKMVRRDRSVAEGLLAKLQWTAGDVGVAWALVRRFRVQLEQLHEARARALRTNGRRRLGLTAADVAERCDQVEQQRKALKQDLGI